MKSLFCLFISFLLLENSYPQKLPIQNDTYKAWTEVDEGTLSNNGEYVFYRIKNEPSNSSTYVISSIDKKWEKTLIGFGNLSFNEDSKYLFGIDLKDNALIRLKLNNDEIIKTPNCRNYELLNTAAKEWLIYQQNDSLNTLTIEDIKTGEKTTLHNIKEYLLNNKGTSILTRTGYNNEKAETLNWVDLKSGKIKILFKGEGASNFIFPADGNAVAFTTTIKDTTNIWYYNHLNSSPAQLIGTDNSTGIVSGYSICTDRIWQFSSDGESLFFSQIKKDNVKLNKRENPEIWSYQDAYLMPLYKNTDYGIESISKDYNLTKLDLKQKKIMQLLQGTQKPISIYSKNNEVLIVESSFGRQEDLPWNAHARISYYLCFTKSGELRPIKRDCVAPIEQIELSPNNDFLLYFDPEVGSFLSYNIKTNKTEDISKSFNSELGKYYTVRRSKVLPSTIAAWVSGRNKAIIQGTHDLWEVDLENKEVPHNLTEQEKSAERLIYFFSTWHQDKVVSDQDNILVSSFNSSTKEYGFYVLNLSKRKLKRLYTTSCYMGTPYDVTASLIKAKYSKSYLVKLGKTNKSPNYSFTKNFKQFIPISNIYPERSYNWIKSELVAYKDKFGNQCEGILYSPENFDATKKYPVIFYYYLDVSDKVNEYISPEPSGIGFNIPKLVSNGYIIFRPNIYQFKGRPGESALISVMAAVDHMVKLNWVDSTKLGIVGHSFGGFETNYIVSHTDRFSAAIAAAAPSNWVQLYNELWGQAGTKQNYLQNGPGFMGNGLDKIPNEYIANSPILYAKNIKTPLLLLHNDGDEAVPVNHSEQLFVQLRSLKKRVWLLKYEGESHILVSEENQLDFQSRLESFFGHFLRNAPMPQWMINHVSPNALN